MSMMSDGQGQKKSSKRRRCRKDIVRPDTVSLGRGVKNDTTVIAGWGAI